MFGIAAYANMNVMDGYVCVIDGDVQRNLRFSRYLRPEIDRTAVGPFEFEIVEPLRKHAARLGENPIGVEFDVTWTALAEPHLERPHQRVSDGRVIQDYRRYGQSGILNGTMTVDGERYVLGDWFSMRDHAWGVRRHVGGVEPYVSVADDFRGLFIWLQFAAGGYSGNLQIIEEGDGTRRYFDGAITVEGEGTQRLTEAEYEFDIPEGSRLFDAARITVTRQDGGQFVIGARPVHRPWVLKGSGYDLGFADGLGHGADRGEYLLEHDDYGLLDSGRVRFPDGEERDPWHREYGSRVTIDGQEGFGHAVLMVEGRIEKLGRTWPPMR